MFTSVLKDIGGYLNNEYGVNIDGETVISHILWADDIILLSNTKKGLQNHLDKLYQYCSTWHLIVNTMETKVHVMIFGTRGRREQFLYNQENLEMVQEYKFLGCIYSSSGKEYLVFFWFFFIRLTFNQYEGTR